MRANPDAIRAIRQASGDTQATLARRAGVSKQVLHNIETGRTPTPRPATLRAIADALSVPLGAITLGREVSR